MFSNDNMLEQAAIVLASSSVYRKRQLDSLQLYYNCHSPDIDETALAGETAEQCALRVAEAKARAVAHAHPEQWIISADQTLGLDGNILSKPGSMDGAIKQLTDLSGRDVVFYSALCLHHARLNKTWVECVSTTVRYRSLTPRQIRAYLHKEPAIDCAGSFKSEGLGIALLERVQSDDPSALIGLPMIALTALLNRAGIDVLSHI